ncbi:hypothetical protein N9478_08480 [Gammaproteobacteria bacterium]|jgi:hypothetical protein|nr:hypothetical protein [Gammaproteobacteria bacterium]
MKKVSAAVAGSIILFNVQAAIAADAPVIIGGVEMPAVESSAAFDQIKKKLGKWEGQLTQSLTGDVIDVSYEWTLVSGGSTIMESVVEDGVGMFTTYSDEEGELVVKHYCALGTEPVLSVSEATDRVVALSFNGSRSPLMSDSHDFVNSMRWTMDASDSDSMVYEYTVYLNGELTSNRAELKRQ